jgi:hypothetical protein
MQYYIKPIGVFTPFFPLHLRCDFFEEAHDAKNKPINKMVDI